ncbi:MAG: alkene reductase [Alphaproteobacteria bacterium]|nr:alkene reductase [Alphaproteobacteria bacterium]
MSRLLSPFDLRGLHLPNRVVMAPMTRGRATNPERAATALHATYYRQRASAGLLITEGTQVSAEGSGYIGTPGIHTDAQQAGWKLVTDAVHDAGGRIFAQLWHVGRISHPDHLGGALPLAPSAINPHVQSFTPEGFKDTVTPRAMTEDDIRRTIDDFARAAVRAMAAGFDGVELHASNGYLFHQFFTRCSNQRTDRWGGSIEGRIRFLVEVLDAVERAGVPLDRVGVRLNPSAHGVFGITVDEETLPTFDAVVDHLDTRGIAYLHLSEPGPDVSSVPHAEPHIARRYRPRFRGPLIINRGFTLTSAEAVLTEGLADAVAFGVPFIANPDLVDRFRAGLPLATPDRATFYSGGATGYVDYPSAG